MNDSVIVREVAGLLSTIEFNPSEHHPDRMEAMARQVVGLVETFNTTILDELRSITDLAMSVDRGETWNRLEELLHRLGRPF